MENFMESLVSFVTSAFLFPMAGVYLLVWLFLRTPIGDLFKDPPGKRKVHQRTIPRLGGVCIIISFLSSLYFWHVFGAALYPRLSLGLFDSVIFASLTVLIIGILDDTYLIEIQNKAKFILEVLIALEIVFLMGVRIGTISLFGVTVTTGWWGVPLTILWLVGVSNAINIIDGVDGLAASISLIGFVTISVLAALAQETGLLLLAVTSASVTTGFLLHNRPPARAFLGDTGSLFLGMMLGLLSVRIISIPTVREPHSVAIAVLVVGIPILDVFTAMVRRFVQATRAKKSLFKAAASMAVADNDHMHHRLLYHGLSHAQVTAFLTLVNGTFCAAAVVISQTPPLVRALTLLYVVGLSGWLLLRVDFLYTIPAALRSFFVKTDSPAARKIIGIVTADDVLHHALSQYDQTTFTFLFLSNSDILCSPHRFESIVVVNEKADLFEEDRAYAHRLSMLHQCPVVLISHDRDPLFNPSLNELPGTVYHASRPVYIPALLNELDSLSREPAPQVASRRRLINITRMQPILGWSQHGKAFSKK